MTKGRHKGGDWQQSSHGAAGVVAGRDTWVRLGCRLPGVYVGIGVGQARVGAGRGGRSLGQLELWEGSVACWTAGTAAWRKGRGTVWRRLSICDATKPRQPGDLWGGWMGASTACFCQKQDRCTTPRVPQPAAGQLSARAPFKALSLPGQEPTDGRCVSRRRSQCRRTRKSRLGKTNAIGAADAYVQHSHGIVREWNQSPYGSRSIRMRRDLSASGASLFLFLPPGPALSFP